MSRKISLSAYIYIYIYIYIWHYNYNRGNVYSNFKIFIEEYLYMPFMLFASVCFVLILYMMDTLRKTVLMAPKKEEDIAH